MMAGTLARHRMFSDMDYADYMNYMDQMKRPWDPGFTHRNEDMLDYKLFFARKLKSIFTEQNRLRQHLVQIADLEWDLKQHYYLYGDEYRSGRLGDRYRHLQSRIQQMQTENSYLQSRTGLRLERYMLAQAALGDLSDECCVPMSNVNDLCYDIDDFDVLRRRTRNNRMVASGLCTPDMLCRAYSTSNSEQVYDRYEDHINALFEIERKRHVEEYVKSRERFLHSEPPRTDSQSLLPKPETSFYTPSDGPDPYLDGLPMPASRTSDSQSLFQKPETSFCTSIKGPDTYLDGSPVSASQASNSVATAEAAVQVSPQDMASTFSNELSNPTSMESLHYLPDEQVRSSRRAAPNISESVSAESINACLKTNSLRDRQPMTSPSPQTVKPDAFLESSFRNISETQRYNNLPKELSNGGPNVPEMQPPMVKPEAIRGVLYGNRPNTQPDNRFQNESADSGPNVPLIPPPMVKAEAIIGGFSGYTSKTQPDNRFHKESSAGGSNVLQMPPPMVKPEAIRGGLYENPPNAQPDNRFHKENSDGGPNVPAMSPPMVKPEAILGGFHRNGFSRDISELSLGEYFSNGSASTLKDNQSLSQTTPRVVPNQRTSNIFDLLDGDFKENLNKSQRESKEKGRPVPEWADQIVEGIKRNLTERHEQSKVSHRHASKNQYDDQDQTDYSSSDSYQVNGSRKRASNRKKSRIPVRKPAKTFVYTYEDKEKVLKNVKMCMIKERKFNIVSEFKRYGKK